MTAAPDLSSSETLVEMGRLNGLSDGVFAFALTLLVLDIRIPEEALVGELPARLLGLAPKALIYLISFVVIGGSWGAHQRLLSQVRRGDGVLVWFNLFSLLFVTLLPASAALLGRFPTAPAALVCFATDVILIQLTGLWLWRHASQHGLISPALDPRVVESIGRRLGFSGLAFGVSIPLAWFSPWIVYVLWVSVFVLILTTDWLSWQFALKTRPASLPLDGAARARLFVQHGAGQLIVQAGPRDANLLSGVFGGGLRTRAARVGDLLDVQLCLANQPRGFMSLRFPWTWGPTDLLDWTCRLNPDIPLALNIETAGGQATLDLETLKVCELNLNTSASSATVSLPARAGQTAVTIEAGTASLVMRVPTGVAASIHAQKALATAEIDVTRFPAIADGRHYESPDYDLALNRVDIQLTIAMGSIKIV
jgi:uncharacterized membrane protein